MACGNCEQCGVFEKLHETDIRSGWYCADCTWGIIVRHFEATVAIDPNTGTPTTVGIGYNTSSQTGRSEL